MPRRDRRQEDGPEAAGGDPFDLGYRLVDVGEGNGGGGRQTIEVRREPFHDVVVVHAGMRHGQFVVVGIEAEEGEIGMHHPDVDPVEGEVLDDHFRVTLGHAAARLAVPGDRPPFEAGRVQPPEDPGPALDERLYLEVVLPHGPVPQMRGQPGDEQIGRLENVPIGGNDKLFLRHDRDLPAWGRATPLSNARRARRARATLQRECRPTGRYRQRWETVAAYDGQKEMSP